MFYQAPFQPPPPPTSKFKKYTGKCWYFCVKFKINCSIWMLLAFAALMIYFNDNYINLTISLPSTMSILSFGGQDSASSFSSSSSSSLSSTGSDSIPSYLHPFALYKVPYGSCPFTTPAYPNIGPDIPYICPSTKPYRIGSAWYLEQDLLDNRKDKDDNKDIMQFFAEFERLKSIMTNNTDSKEKGMTKRLKKTDGLHLSYLYTSCQTQKEVKTIHDEWNDIIQTTEYQSIFKEAGYKSWEDVQVCFDRVLCMNDNYFGGVTYNLYLDKKSQDLMQKLVAKTEEIQENKYNVDLTFKRKDQQSFHITLGTITNTKDYDAFDGKELMDIINDATKGRFPCIKLTKKPPIQNYICKNKKTLQKASPKFDWDCTDI